MSAKRLTDAQKATNLKFVDDTLGNANLAPDVTVGLLVNLALELRAYRTIEGLLAHARQAP